MPARLVTFVLFLTAKKGPRHVVALSIGGDVQSEFHPRKAGISRLKTKA
jgi:hypothetical protein